ncbi:hypothetical protein [Rhodopirellula halodulae]|nr:hypothetical protein [Rhodopirellula sp. JC740]
MAMVGSAAHGMQWPGTSFAMVFDNDFDSRSLFLPKNDRGF